MRAALVAAVATVALLSAGDQAAAQTVRVQPLAARDGVVVGGRARSQTVIVATASGRMRAIHSLRRYAVGTRVRVRGIKWGTPLSGVKWGLAPSGIKWGIKWALNGTFSSTLDPIGRASSVRLRGVVIARSRTAVALATAGGVVTVAVPPGTPTSTASVLHAARGGIGRTAVVSARIGRGTLRARRLDVRGLAPVMPVAGQVVAVSPADGTVTIDATTSRTLRVVVTITAPPQLDLASLHVGDEVAALARRDTSGELVLTSAGANQSFAAANDPALQVVPVPPLEPHVIAAIDALAATWDTAVARRHVRAATLAESGSGLIAAARTAAVRGDAEAAVTSLTTFVDQVRAGRRAHPRQIRWRAAKRLIADARAVVELIEAP